MSTEVFAEVGQPNNLVEELAARAEFQNNIVVLARLGKVDQLDDVRVIYLSHDLHFFENVGSLERSVPVSNLPVIEYCASADKRQNAGCVAGMERLMRTSTTFGCFLKSG